MNKAATLAFIIAAGLLVVLAVPASYLSAAAYQAYAGGVQAFGVIIALLVAGLAVQSENNGRKIDRTLELFKTFRSGPVNDARIRLRAHLEQHGPGQYTRETTLRELRNHPVLSKYDDDHRESPLRDAHTLLRFFELAEAARKGQAVSVVVFHELIATHATYWLLAIGTDIAEKPSRSLRNLAQWAETFHSEHGNSDAQWGQTRLERFGRRTPDEPRKSDV